jgi:hypothetical protein
VTPSLSKLFKWKASYGSNVKSSLAPILANLKNSLAPIRFFSQENFEYYKNIFTPWLSLKILTICSQDTHLFA